MLFTIPLGGMPVAAYPPIKDGDTGKVVGIHGALNPIQPIELEYLP